MSVKKGRVEAQRIAAAIKSYKVEYYVSDCDTEDDYKGVEACSQALEKSSPDCAVMLLAAGVGKLNVTAVVPENKRDKLSAKEWVEAALASVGGTASEESTDAFAFGTIDGNPAEDKFPIKMKDIARGGAFALLKQKSLVVEEEDDDEPDFSAFDI